MIEIQLSPSRVCCGSFYSASNPESCLGSQSRFPGSPETHHLGFSRLPKQRWSNAWRLDRRPCYSLLYQQIPTAKQYPTRYLVGGWATPLKKKENPWKPTNQISSNIDQGRNLGNSPQHRSPADLSSQWLWAHPGRSTERRGTTGSDFLFSGLPLGI